MKTIERNKIKDYLLCEDCELDTDTDAQFCSKCKTTRLDIR